MKFRIQLLLRSTIALKKNDNTYLQVYCHWDGYPEYNGFILFEHYNTPKKIEELLKNGSISSLGEKCSKPEGHSFDNRVLGYTTYYHRDRGENWEINKTETSLVLKEEYNYLFIDGEWYVNDQNLEPILKEIDSKKYNKIMKIREKKLKRLLGK